MTELAVDLRGVSKRYVKYSDAPTLVERALRPRRRSRRSELWAVRDVDLRAEPGSCIGLIGRNGSGKSTVLRMIAGVTAPTSGSVTVRGRVAPLISVGVGFHPELTGRENIVLAGTLLGLRRREVVRRLDEIAAFAEIESAIDRPVKYYSSGMQMRLGFAVAAFLEPDVLLVDEVLAVGDAPFQQRCLDRMRAVLAAGTTLVFVSHDLAALEATCTRGLWLRDGVAVADGDVAETLAAYRGWVERSSETGGAWGGDVRLVEIGVETPDDVVARSDGDVTVRMLLQSAHTLNATVCLGVSEGTAAPVFVIRTDADLAAGRTEVACALRHLPLPGGRFYVWAGVFDGERDLMPWQPVATLDTIGPRLDRAPRGIVRLAPVHVSATWTATAVDAATVDGRRAGESTAP